MAKLPITINFPPVPEDWNGNLDALVQWIAENGSFEIEGQFLTGQIGGTEPTTDIGIWISNGMLYAWDADKARYVPSVGIPIGGVLPWTSVSGDAPTGFLFCEGQTVLRADYPDLFAVIGTTYGTTTSLDYKLPDYRGRSLLGGGNDAGAAHPETTSNTKKLPVFLPGTYGGAPYGRNTPNWTNSESPNQFSSSTFDPSSTSKTSNIYPPFVATRILIRAT